MMHLNKCFIVMFLRVKKNLQRRKPCVQRGFSLLEVMIALLVFIILMVVTVNVVKNQYVYDHLVENDLYMTQVKKSFITFVKVNRFLPCPDTDGDGKENRAGAPKFECTKALGTVPFLDLGVPATDVWNQPLLYAINTRADSDGVLDIDKPKEAASYFNNGADPVLAPAPVFTLNTYPIGEEGEPGAGGGSGNYRVCGEIAPFSPGCSASIADERSILEHHAIAVVVSFGENGGATWKAINAGETLGFDDAEAENMDGDRFYWQGVGSQREGLYFDDKLFWLVGTDLKYAIISSGGSL